MSTRLKDPDTGKFTKGVRVHCDQCQMLSICGVACHEIGCLNMGSRWDIDAYAWVKQRECRECGCTVDADTHCCCDCWDCRIDDGPEDDPNEDDD